MKRSFYYILSLGIFALVMVPTVTAEDHCETSTQVKGHCQQDRFDQDNNEIPDEGITVSGHYTLTQGGCDYVVNYRGNFENNPYLDSGWVYNHIQCDDGRVYQYLIVHESDPRYTGNPDWAIWNTWEIHNYVIGGPGASGNIVQH